MTDREVERAPIEKDAAVAEAMASPRPAWVISTDGRSVLLANPPGRALAIGPGDAPVFQRIAAGQGPGAPPRMQKLRLGGALEPFLCSCARVELGGGRRALLVEALATPRGMRAPASGPAAPARPSEPAPGPPPAMPPVEQPAMVGAVRATIPAVDAAAAEPRRRPDEAAPEPARLPEPARSPERAAAPDPSAEHPIRFIFETDAEGRVTYVSPDQVETLGPATARLLGHVWAEAAAELGLDEEGEVARALARRETWSGLSIAWPFASGVRERIELSALPVFDPRGGFTGFRGLGVRRPAAEAAAAAAAPGAPAEPEQKITEANGKIIDFEARTGVRTAPSSDRPHLSPNERSNFREIARALSARPEGSAALADLADAPPEPVGIVDQVPSGNEGWKRRARSLSAVLDRLPVGTLVRRGAEILAANRRMLEMAGCTDLETLSAIEMPSGAEAGGPPVLRTAAGAAIAVDAVLHPIEWDGAPATLLLVAPLGGRAGAFGEEELAAILDLGGDGIVIADGEGLIRHVGASAAQLFGYGSELAGAPFTLLLAAESRLAAIDDFEAAKRGETSAFAESRRPVVGLDRRGTAIPMLMKAGRLPGTDHVALLFRNISAFREAEERLIAAKQKADEASAQKSDFLAKISHEIRTPLNAIIGFAEVIGEERFGPVGTPRYREYLADIRASGEHVLSLVNDLLDLSKIEAGGLELTFTAVQLNDLVQQCVAIMQPQSAGRQIIMRTSLSPNMPQVVADSRSIRQIVLNLLSNAVKFTQAGGQVIVATTVSEDGEAVLRVRDNGRGMTDGDVLTALEPFRQIGTTVPGGTGLGLPLTKALTEANEARFAIRSRPGEGTLVEIAFPPGRVLAR